MAAVRELFSTLQGLARAGVFRQGGSAGPVMEPVEGEYAHAGPEPSLDDLLQDPLVLQVMQADHLELAQVRGMLGLAARPAAA